MHENFLGLKQTKRDAIINASLDEFAQKGYHYASTNVIVHAAGISKGSLFHYFSSKKELFFYLCDYTFSMLDQDYLQRIPSCNGDLILRYGQAVLQKMGLSRRYPKIFEFAWKILTEDAPEVKGKVQEKKTEILEKSYRYLLADLDYSLFRCDVPAEKIQQIILWTIEGYGNHVTAQLQDLHLSEIDQNAMAADFNAYLDILRQCFYRQKPGD